MIAEKDLHEQIHHFHLLDRCFLYIVRGTKVKSLIIPSCNQSDVFQSVPLAAGFKFSIRSCYKELTIYICNVNFSRESPLLAYVHFQHQATFYVMTYCLFS